ncbi:MAG: hypothetical protein PHH54_02100 [Candidatus Nanoarchaeia archaeon]|nr:hypothetical protein [Candidatus Nanoarchaeia archaeon]MDD5740754.1 hypothetical protein [Candidatus Nanoarchaeia archaeon]
MGIFDFFKKKKTESEVEIVGFDEIKEFLSKKRQEIEEKQTQPKKEIRDSINELVSALEEEAEALKNIDLQNKRAMDMEKLIVRQNLDNFIHYLEELISNLQKTDSESFETLINNVNSVFSDFEKKSIISFQKSTYLIGEELGRIRDDIAKFFRFFNNLVKENRFSIDQMKLISAIKEKLNEISSLEKVEYENKETIIDIEDKIKSLEEKIRDKRREIGETKESKGYIEQVNVRQELERKKTKLAIELQKLKEMIDFKALARIYHSAERQMFLIKEYRDNFRESFERDGPEKLLDLIDIKEINQKPIKEKIKLIDEIKQNIDNIIVDKDITQELERDISDIRSKIRDLISEKSKKEKIDAKFQENKEQIKRQVSEQLKSFNAILE